MSVYGCPLEWIMQSLICPIGYRIPHMFLQLIPIFLVNNIITFPTSNDVNHFWWCVCVWVFF